MRLVAINPNDMASTTTEFAAVAESAFSLAVEPLG
jgi:hypothetical protein